MDGEGTLRFAAGGRFKGTFRDGKRDGRSVEIRADGTRIDCTYREGQSMVNTRSMMLMAI